MQEFHKIAGALDRRSTRDCIEFYYRIQKQDEFAVVRRKIQVGPLCLALGPSL